MFYKTKIIESQKYSWGSETMIWPHTVCTVLIPALIIHLKILLDSGWLSYSACSAKKCRMSVKGSEYSKMEVLLMETPQRGAQNKNILSMLHVGEEDEIGSITKWTKTVKSIKRKRRYQFPA